MLVIVGAGGGGATILVHSIEGPQSGVLRLEKKEKQIFKRQKNSLNSAAVLSL